MLAWSGDCEAGVVTEVLGVPGPPSGPGGCFLGQSVEVFHAPPVGVRLFG